MTKTIDRTGIFKAQPVRWLVKNSAHSASVAIAIEFVIISQLDGSEWASWAEYEEHRVWGDFWIIGREGKPNIQKCEQLAAALGWSGQLRDVVAGGPPPCIVQVTVKENVYEGKTSFRVDWIEPEDYVPTGGGADADEIDALDNRFGSLLRAAVAGKTKAPPKAAAKQAAPKAAPAAAAPAAAAKSAANRYGFQTTGEAPGGGEPVADPAIPF